MNCKQPPGRHYRDAKDLWIDNEDTSRPDWDKLMVMHGVEPGEGFDEDYERLEKAGVDPEKLYAKALLLWG